MRKPSDEIKGKLLSIIKGMTAAPWLYVKDPKRDFTRKRKLSFETVLRLLLGMGAGSMQTELLEYFEYAEETATSSAFAQQRDKLLPSAMEHLLREFTMSFADMKRYKGYRLLAVDGSDLHTPTDTSQPENYFQNQPGEKGYNLLHLNAMYDLCNRVYTDALIQSKRHSNENSALVSMVGRACIDGRVIVIADRGYESYNNFAHIEQKGWNYLVRIKDNSCGGILSGLKLPATPEFDIHADCILTRKQTKQIKSQPDIFRYLSGKTVFDFLDLHDNIFYPIKLRIVRFMLSEGAYETVITNLDRDAFPPDELRCLYNMRWGIETSFRQLKYTACLVAFHSKKSAFIAQEVFAALIMYNFAERVAAHVFVRQTDTRYGYQLNFTVAFRICRHFFRARDPALVINPEALILKYILPIRPGRHAPRIVRFKQAVCFNYRFA